jgi:TatD DNase family protein
MIVETHAHLNMEDYKDDITEVITRANQAGVKQLVVIGVDLASNLKAIEISEKYDNVFATVGIHPGHLKGSHIEDLYPLLKHKNVVAVGECGIDLYWEKDNIEAQKEMFIRHIDLSIEHDLPLVIHMRNSFDEIYETLQPYKGKVRGVFHCFSSTLSDAKKAIDLGFYIGIDGPITYKKAEDLVEIVKAIDLKHIVVETDSPYLTPTPFRGKRNEPAYLIHVVQKIAEIKGVSVEVVEDITTHNARKLFNLGGIKP